MKALLLGLVLVLAATACVFLFMAAANVSEAERNHAIIQRNLATTRENIGKIDAALKRIDDNIRRAKQELGVERPTP
jgi:septal ring factor EnvC (AmiA/AmiB activator)